MRKRYLNLQAAEPIIFYAVLIANLVPLLAFQFYPSLDGPAHLYNSLLIPEMLKGNEVMESMLKFNSEPVPNWTGHFILSIFNLFLPGWLAEKILLIIYVAGLPLSFRYLVKAVKPQNLYLSLLVFPFTYNFLLLLGFYNFVLSIVFLFLALGYWINNRERANARIFLVLMALILVTYFSHVFVFASLCIALGLITAWQAAVSMFVKENTKDVLRTFGRQAIFLLLAASPALLLAWFFFSSRTLLSQGTHLPGSELTSYLVNLRPLIAYSELAEQMYTRKMFYIITALALTALFFRIWRDRVIALRDVFLLAGLFLMLLYFLLPDADSSGTGFVSVRMCLLVYLFIVLWIAMQKIPRWIALPAAALILFLHAGKIKFHMEVMITLEDEIHEMNSVSEYIPENSIVYCYNFSDNWLQRHIFNYAAIDRPVMMLENYEATLDWFPLKWRRSEMPSWQVGRTGLEGICRGWFGNISERKEIAPYILTWRSDPPSQDTCNQHFSHALYKDYTEVYASPERKAILYKLKQ